MRDDEKERKSSKKSKKRSKSREKEQSSSRHNHRSRSRSSERDRRRKRSRSSERRRDRGDRDRHSRRWFLLILTINYWFFRFLPPIFSTNFLLQILIVQSRPFFWKTPKKLFFCITYDDIFPLIFFCLMYFEVLFFRFWFQHISESHNKF